MAFVKINTLNYNGNSESKMVHHNTNLLAFIREQNVVRNLQFESDEKGDEKETKRNRRGRGCRRGYCCPLCLSLTL